MRGQELLKLPEDHEIVRVLGNMDFSVAFGLLLVLGLHVMDDSFVALRKLDEWVEKGNANLFQPPDLMIDEEVWVGDQFDAHHDPLDQFMIFFAL